MFYQTAGDDSIVVTFQGQGETGGLYSVKGVLPNSTRKRESRQRAAGRAPVGVLQDLPNESLYRDRL